MFIYSYNKFSEGAKNLSDATNFKRIKHQNSNFRGKPSKTVINWGSSSLPEEVLKCRIINCPLQVRICSDKLDFFKHLDDTDSHASVPEWTTDQEVVVEWLSSGHTAVARKVLNGHSAEGLVMIDDAQGMVQAPLYTKYIPKKHEFRVHIFGEEVLDIQRKAKKIDFEGAVDWRVRNLANGFIYAREGFETPDDVLNQAKIVVKDIGLDFGAVDVIWNEAQQKAYVLEVNTAPGITGTTVERYAEAFKNVGEINV